MKQIKLLTYSPDLALSKKYLKATIQSLKPKIFDEKVEVLFEFFNLKNKTSTYTLNTFGSKHYIVTSK